MGGFFKNPMESGKSNFEKAISRLQEGSEQALIGGDTKEEDGRYFLYNMEVSEGEYEQFMNAYNTALSVRNEQKAEDLDNGDDQEKVAA